MSNNQFKELVKRIIEAGDPSLGVIRPCDEKEIREIEERFEVKLPAAYKNFLRLLGKRGGIFLCDGLWQYPLDLTLPGALTLLEESESTWEIPQGVFVFYSCDYHFAFFEIGVSDDPPVQIYMLGKKEPEPEPYFDSFSSWFKTKAEEDLAAVANLVRIHKENVDRLYQEDVSEH